MKRISLFSAFVALAFAASNALAQEEHGHLDVFVGVSGGSTAYGGIDVDDGDIELNERVFEAEMAELDLGFATIFTADEPGFNHPGPADAAFGMLPAGVSPLVEFDEIFVNKLPLTVDGVTADLFFWDGTGSPSFAPAVGTLFDIVAGTGGSIGTAGAGGDFDDHPEFEISTPGGGLPTPGIYLGSFNARVNSLEPTDPLFLVMGTDGLAPTDEELEELIEMGVEFVETSVLPEPTSATLIGIAVVAFAGRRRR